MSSSKSLYLWLRFDSKMLGVCAAIGKICSLGWVMKGAHDIIVSVDEQIFIIGESDFAATILGEEHGVANLDESFADAAIFHGLSRSTCDNSSKVKSFFFTTGEDDTTLGFGEGFGLLDNDTVEERSESFEREHFFILEDLLL